MFSKKAMEFEVIVKAVLALIILVVLIGLLYIFVINKGAAGANTIVDDTTEQGDSVLGDLRDLIGGKCDSGTKCSLSGQELRCDDGEWVETGNDC